MKKSHWLCLGFAVVVVWTLMELIVNPSGDMPLNDDWSFAVSVKRLVETGVFSITCWTLAGSIFQILSASALCKVLGFSFLYLRAYTLFFAGLALLFVLLVCHKINRRLESLLFLLLFILTDPFFFLNANSYMTDVPTTALVAGGFYFLCRTLVTGSGKAFLAGTILSCLAVSNREVTVVLPIAFFITALVLASAKFRRVAVTSAWLSALPAVLSIALISAHSFWLIHGPGLPFCMQVEQLFLQKMIAGGPLFLAVGFIGSATRLCVYLGLIMSPLSFFLLPSILAGCERKRLGLAVAVLIEMAVLLPAGLLVLNAFMPLGDNCLYDFGLGPVILKAPALSALPFMHAPRWLWCIVTVYSGIGAAVLLTELVIVVRNLWVRSRRNSLSKADAQAMLALFVCFIFSVVICFRGWFDRYLILLLVMLSLALFSSQRQGEVEQVPLLAKMKPICASAALIFLLLFGSFSVAGTRDYFTWQRAIWQTLDCAVNQAHIPKGQISGNYEFNHWKLYDTRQPIDVTVNDEPAEENARYIISFEPLSGYAAVLKTEFNSWLWGGRRAVYLLEKR